jgi:hypothetical protein
MKGADLLTARPATLVAGLPVDRNAGLSMVYFYRAALLDVPGVASNPKCRCTFPAEPALASALPSHGGSLAG